VTIRVRGELSAALGGQGLKATRPGAAEPLAAGLADRPAWHSAPGRPCDPGTSIPDEVSAHADEWFPEGRGPQHTARAAAAAERCWSGAAAGAPCPVLDECFAWALAPVNAPRYGVWGGHSVRELDELRIEAIDRGELAPADAEVIEHRPVRGPRCRHGEADGYQDGRRWRCRACNRESAAARRSLPVA
jgi:hypothetical protein